jgi:hypothetical protein
VTHRHTCKFLTIAFLTFSCGRPVNGALVNKAETPKVPLDNSAVKRTFWYDSLVLNYINNTDDELIKMARKDNIPEDWLLDIIKNTDTAKYYIFHLGHDVEDSGGSNKHFVTDGWVYIDSLTRKMYELNVQTDHLIEWKK